MTSARRVVVLGASGSIGTQTLEVCAHHPERFDVVGLGAGRSLEALCEAVRRLRPALVALEDPADAGRARNALADAAPEANCSRSTASTAPRCSAWAAGPRPR